MSFGDNSEEKPLASMFAFWMCAEFFLACERSGSSPLEAKMWSLALGCLLMRPVFGARCLTLGF